MYNGKTPDNLSAKSVISARMNNLSADCSRGIDGIPDCQSRQATAKAI
jgi:hypothetical protein